MTSYLILLLAVIMLAASFAFQKLYEKNKGSDILSGLVFNALSGLFSIPIFFVIGGFSFGISLYSVLMALLMSVLATTYTVIGFRILKDGNMALYTLFLMSGGMMLPYIFGVFVLHEEFSVLRAVGLILILIAVIVSNKGDNGKKVKTQQLILCAAVFALNGGVSIISKLHQTEEIYETVSAAGFVLLSGVFKAILSGILILIYAKRESKNTEAPKSKGGLYAILIVFIFSIFSGLSYMFQLIGAKDLPATVLYPMVTGGSIIFSTLAGIAFFREKVGKSTIFAVALCFAGTLLFL